MWSFGLKTKQIKLFNKLLRLIREYPNLLSAEHGAEPRWRKISFVGSLKRRDVGDDVCPPQWNHEDRLAT
jgi:hypothetical protein